VLVTHADASVVASWVVNGFTIPMSLALEAACMDLPCKLVLYLSSRAILRQSLTLDVWRMQDLDTSTKMARFQVCVAVALLAMVACAHAAEAEYAHGELSFGDNRSLSDPSPFALTSSLPIRCQHGLHLFH
jgi:hypothetical protein